MNKGIMVLGISMGGLCTIAISALMIFGYFVPETYVYLGHQVPRRYMKIIRSLGFLEVGEDIKYFYTDAMLDIKQGFCFVSNKKVVLYSELWEEPEYKIAFEDITDLSVEYDDSFIDDSIITIITNSDMEIPFPVSSEKGRDKKFYNFIEERCNIERNKKQADGEERRIPPQTGGIPVPQLQ